MCLHQVIKLKMSSVKIYRTQWKNEIKMNDE